MLSLDLGKIRTAQERFEQLLRWTRIEKDGVTNDPAQWQAWEEAVSMVLGASRSAPQRHMAHAPPLSLGLACWFADARQPRDFLRHTGSKRMPVRTVLGFVGE